MKSILLASVASVAFAGVAAAEVTFSGSASLGWNNFDNTSTDDNFGFYHDLSVDVGFSQELDNGLTVAASIGLGDLAAGSLEEAYELSLTSETAGLYVGDTATAAEAKFSTPDGMDLAFNANDDLPGDEYIRGEVTLSGFDVAVSMPVAVGGMHATEFDEDFIQLAVGGTFGSANVGLAYQGAGYTGDDMIGLSAGTSLGGADLDLAYISSGAANSIGLGVSYPAGPVTLGAYYAMNDDGTTQTDAWGISADYASGPVSVSASFDSSEDWSLEGSYDVGNGVMVYAGVVTAGDDYYVGGTYDLGGGASLLVSHAVDDDNSSGDEVGANDYQVGTTVEVSFSF